MRILVLILCVFISGCASAPYQKITPFKYTEFKEICIIENLKVAKKNYLQAFKSALQKKGYAVKMLNDGAKKSDCEVTATYTANWSWDLVLYMSDTKIKVYKNGEKSGEASYKPRGVFSKFIDADRIAALVPPPRRHRHRYHGVLAPNAPLRELVTERAGLSVSSRGATAACGDEPKSVAAEEQTVGGLYASIWAMLITRIYEINPLVCSKCGGEMRIIAFVTEIEPIGRILRHMGEPDYAPEISPARGPPNFCLEPDQVVDWDIAVIEPVPEYQFDQTVNW